MKYIKFLLVIFALLFSFLRVEAVEFKLLVLPTDIMSVCDNYFCFQEPSNIMAQDTIKNFKNYKGVKVYELPQVRAAINQNQTLQAKIQTSLNQYAQSEKVDFATMKEIADYFDVNSILLITSYATNDKVNSRNNLWDTLEISSAFQITYPSELKTSVVLLDCVNNIIMWSGKYSKNVSDSKGLYSATNQTQAMSQLEKVKLYSKDNIAQNISQNVYMRFFPREVRTFYVTKSKTTNEPETKFMPNALEHLKDSHMQKQFEKDTFLDYSDASDEFIFEF